MAEYPRPKLCPDPACRPLFQWPAPTFLIEDEDDSRERTDPPGESWTCFGMLPEPVSFTASGSEHTNDCRSCHFTPLKGLVAYQENAEDWYGLQRAYDKALKRLKASRPCEQCGGSGEVLLKGDGGGATDGEFVAEAPCPLCAGERLQGEGDV
jgi:hypothetical protein